ncbi:MAG: carboxypeptidase regulatory-like domain-containing protein [Pyrinomonadaceae bacterium]
MGFSINLKQFNKTALMLMFTLAAVVAASRLTHAEIVINGHGNLGVIKGVVRDDGGNPIAEASVAIFRNGTSQLLKQVTSARDGGFIARIVPGTYTVLAVAQGFNPVTLFGVQVGHATELTYGFKLERAGSGNTLPEKRLDRNSSKWRVRAAQTQRSIYQNREGDSPIVEDTRAADDVTTARSRKGETVVETIVSATDTGNSAGLNIATSLPIGDDSDVMLAGQFGRGEKAPLQFHAAVRLAPFDNHRLRFNSSIGKLGVVGDGDQGKVLGQVSFQALDEWKVRGGIIFVFGLDYSRFLGAGDDSAISPRLGLQYDLNSKTRLRTGFTAQTEERSWANAIDLEGQSFAFAEPISVDDLVIENGKPLMNKSRRLEFGIERIIDNRSSVEANVFFDTTISRGVGLDNFAFDGFDIDGTGDFVATQQGKTQGVRVVYTRRIGSLFSASGGYSFGTGQKISAEAISDPSRIFETDFFQSFFAQLAADLRSGTSIRTVYRLSPQATVFAIDPFKGRLAIYDPGLSVYVTQSLPTLGLPFRAQATVDARNVFDFQSGVSGDEGGLRFTAQGRMLRGGIQVRF